MAKVIDALNSLNIKEFILNGEPTSEDEFNKMFLKVTGSDENNTVITSSNKSDFGVTWKQITDKQKELDVEYDKNEYQRDRQDSYPPIGDQLDALYHGGVFPKEMADLIKSVKDKYPKG